MSSSAPGYTPQMQDTDAQEAITNFAVIESASNEDVRTIHAKSSTGTYYEVTATRRWPNRRNLNRSVLERPESDKHQVWQTEYVVAVVRPWESAAVFGQGTLVDAYCAQKLYPRHRVGVPHSGDLAVITVCVAWATHGDKAFVRGTEINITDLIGEK